MNPKRRTCWAVFALTLITTAIPPEAVLAQEPVNQTDLVTRPSSPMPISDIELMRGGVLSGQVLDSAGRPMSDQTVVVVQPNQEPIAARSDHEGRFQASGLNAGLCAVRYGEYVTACRCWNANTAPPAATNQLLLTPSKSIQRGQRPIADLFTGPVLIGLIIAAAVAIPIAVHNSKKSAS